MRGAGAVAVLGLLMGCTAPVSTGMPVAPATAETETPNRAALPTELPPELYALAFDLTMARTLAAECGGGVSVNEGLTDTILQEATRDLSVQGYTSADIQRVRETLPEARVAADRAAYYQSNAITPDNPDSFCAAARREASARTGIGRFLAVGA
ncbi:hypothetical protein Dshi_1318 [Dinoroseobacter shibae DFL 12 = DSM 16493]|uniref:Lipoprotein n=1 Tax=Dinoroseobacter shibae (strain DSM 16493 / NCIMB 14021 / DFL 12) TaxID=398580 RepID=A8LIU6_DINSH|nr:DUF5333 family protein [Dinoroseobacter shibae]ABV93060.1 hypothetical protein Dshi_1318 [Dinoroseobacter shibae DFL 12 = DSM 16493]URF47991.1 DUF5333 domain-containing protein [Dinoroseobacter shibae]URF52300.1 DUF5333 domain-containing protein [Dinoroseobacter shibae]